MPIHVDPNDIIRAVEACAPLAGTMNLHRRKTDMPGGMKPWQQFLLSLLIAIVIGVGSGYISAQIALAVHAERIASNTARVEKLTDRFNDHIVRPGHR